MTETPKRLSAERLEEFRSWFDEKTAPAGLDWRVVALGFSRHAQALDEQVAALKQNTKEVFASCEAEIDRLKAELAAALAAKA